MRDRALVPQLLIALLPFFLRHGQREVHRFLAGHADIGPARLFAIILIALLDRQLFRRDRPVAGGDRIIGSALENGGVVGLLGDQRDRLDARGSGADDPDRLAGKIDALVRPAVGPVDCAGEILHSRNIDILGL